MLGDTLEALLLLVFASLSVGIAVTQEARSERTLEALRDLTSPRALVIRDGERRRIAGRDVVRGDLVVLSEGDRVPADGTLIEAHELLTDESLLTGESVPVRKRAAEKSDEASAQPGGDDLPYVFSGTLIVRGQGVAEVTCDRPQDRDRPHWPDAQRNRNDTPAFDPPDGAARTCRGGRRPRLLSAGRPSLRLAARLLAQCAARRHCPRHVDAARRISLVLTVFMVMGAWRMSQARVLTRRAAAIETLGEATVLCTDKTGTLTENRMTVAALHAAGETLNPSGATALAPPFQHLAVTAALASAPDAYDPMDRAFHDLADRTDGAAAEAP